MGDNDSDILNLNIQNETEKNRLLNEFNKKGTEYMKKTIQQLFEEQVEKTPDNIAVVFNGQKLTYKELNERANSLARVLREKGAEAEKIIGIMVDRSLEMIIGIIGILKAGSAYLPIDPEYPVERIKYMLEDSSAEILITQKTIQKNIDYNGKIIDIENPSLYQREKTNLNMLSGVHNLAYIIYTSGTTGRPKGVLVEHIGIANLKEIFEKKLHINRQDKILQFASMSFDASVWEINMSLLNGAELHILSKETIDNYKKISNYINVHNITVATIPPIYLSNIDEKKIKTLRLLITAGSVINKKILNKWSKKVDYINAYGPTETTICATMWEYTEEVHNLSSVPIGKPLSNLKTYIVDSTNYFELMPIGKVGELCVAGESLARGYINRQELTIEKFVDNPFEPGTKMYRTGDLAKYLDDGNIEFVGRIDDQVKIRGFRIELGEIENQLLKIRGIKEAIVIDKSDMEGDKYLCAYITSEKSMDILSVRYELLKELPAYMIPSYIIQINEFPLTPNGKVDKKALSKLDIIETSDILFEAPRTSVEEILVNVWETVLGIKGIGITHNYYQLGGDSIKSIQIISKLQNHNISLLVKDLMEYPTISELSEHIIYKNIEIEQGEVEGEVQFAPIQKWFFDSKFSKENYWNQSFIFYKKDRIDKQVLRKSFIEIMKHHDALRMIYERSGGGIHQKNRGLEGIEDAFTLDIYDLVEDKNYEDRIELLSSEIQKGMDLEKGILLRVGLFKTPVGDYLLVAMHHVVVDGISWRILIEDLETVYRAIEKQEEVIFPRKTTSYKEWNQKLIEYANSKKMLKEIEYWNTIENTDIKEIPRDFGKHETLMGETKTITIGLSKEETEKLLRKANKAYNTQINDMLLCSLGMAIKEWCGNDKVIINLEGHGRENIIEEVLIDRTIGWFTIMYPVVLDMTNADDITYSIKYIKETLRRIPNKGIGYGVLKYLTNNEIKDKINFKLEPEIIFNYLGEFAQREDTSLFKYFKLISDISSISKENKKTHPIEINGLIIDEELKIEFNYSIKEYKEETINQLSKKYLERLINIINHCEIKQEAEKTPSDYGDNELTIEELEKILAVNKDIQKIHSLTPMQEGMLYNLILDKNSRAYFEQSIAELEGTLNIEILNKVFNYLMEKYEILRTAFFYEGLAKPKQAILRKREIAVNYEDISSLDEEKKQEYIEKFKKNDRDRGFDLARDCLIRASVIKTSDDKYKVICSFHHIIMDGWCLGIIMKDIANIYKSLCDGKEVMIEKAPSYGKYLDWFDKQDKDLALEYWSTYLEGYEQEVTLPKLKIMSDGFDNKEEVIFIDNGLIEKLKNIAKITNTTLNSVIQAAWGILLQKYNNTNDVVFGSVVSGRANEVEGIEKMVGLFINTIPVRIKTDSSMEFKEVVKKLNRDFITFNTYSYCSLAELQSLTCVKNKLINHIFVYENYPVGETSNKKENIKILDFKIFEYTNYDFGILIPPSDELNIKIKITYNGNVYSEEIIKSIRDNLYNLLNSIALNPSVKLSELDMVSMKEKDKLLNEFNNNKEMPSEKTIQELFEEQVEKTPDNIAIVLNDKKLTYRELNEKSNSLGRALREKGVREEKIVGIIMDRSIEMILGIMGILKAGGAYLPIDPEYPIDRIKYMLEDSKAEILLTQNKVLEAINYDWKSMNIEIIEIEDTELYEKTGINLEKASKARNLAYVIYTSGTTGKPKGVMIEHRSAAGTLLWRREEYKLDEKDKVLVLFSYAFDGFVTNFFTTIISGAAAVLVKSEESKDAFAIKKCIEENKITHFICVPILYGAILECSEAEDLESLRIVTLAGDKTSEKLIKLSRSKNEKIELVNEYGPTENSVASTVYRNMEKIRGELVPIGKPRVGTKVYIVDKNNFLMPIGTIGELCVAGNGLARGYLNREELTAEKFVTNQFESDTKMYRTGDLARWLPDGNIEFVGRMDNQVKVRGFRVELGEIENQLLKLEGIKEAAVVNRNSENGDVYIAAYITAESEIAASAIKEELSNELPSYMIPSYIMKLEELPVTVNGKVDRNALTEIDNIQVVTSHYEVPINTIEEILMKIWGDILIKENISINENFFDLGGHSLKATTIINRVNKEFDIKINVKELFENPTIKTFSKVILTLNKKQCLTISKCEEKKEYYKASSAEKRVFALWEMDKLNIAYNIPVVVEIYEEINKEKIENILNKLIQRHEALRTSFNVVDGEIVQKIEEKWQVDYKYEECDKTLVEEKIRDLIKPFDLGKVPLIRCKLIKTEEKRYIFMVDFHHIVTDGVSISILMKEFIELYRNRNLPEPILQYKDFSEWQNSVDKKCELKESEEYWLDRFKGEIPILNIQLDYERPDVKNWEGTRINFTISKELTGKLNNIAKETGTTLYLVLLAAYNVMLSKYSNQEDIVIGTAQAGRPYTEIENVVGMFVNTVALRNYPNKHKIFRDFLMEVKNNTLRDFENSDYQFEKLIKKLGIKRDTSRNPLFDVMFLLEDMDFNLGAEIKLIQPEFNISKFDLTLTAAEITEGIKFNLEYCTKLFKKETIEKMKEHFINILNSITNNLDIEIKDINIISDEKRELYINDIKKNKNIIDELEFDF